jgi:outer membrane lipoprotein-sorting protein
MERKYLVVLMLLGIAAALYAAITYQWVLMVLVVALTALILIAADVLHWVRSLSEAITTGMANLEESVASMKCTVEKIERRLGELENR